MSEEEASCRNCGAILPVEKLQKVGSGRYSRWTGLWSCRSRYQCGKRQKELTERIKRQKEEEFKKECEEEDENFRSLRESLVRRRG